MESGIHLELSASVVNRVVLSRGTSANITQVQKIARVTCELKKGYYAAHAGGLKRELASGVDRGLLRELPRREPWRHFAVLLRQLALLVAAIAGIVYFRDGWWWVAFALNRLGQHYDIRPAEHALRSTLMKPSRFWDLAYLWSNYHLEHHYYPGVPFYNLPRLRGLLEPYFKAKGMGSHGYWQLIYHYLVLNKRPHTDWGLTAATNYDV